MQMNSLKCYDVIKFVITDRLFSEDGLSLGGVHPKQNAMYLYQSIDLESFPSCRDFTGEKTLVKDGYFGIVIRKVGRPHCIHQIKDRWELYDVYEVYTHNFTKRQVFRYNIEKVF